MTQQSSPQNSDDIDIGALWRALMDHKAIILFLVLGSGLATFLGLQFVTPVYTSQARVLIEHEEPVFMRPRSETRSVDTRSLLDPEAVSSQVQVLLSRDLAIQIVKDLRLDENSEFNSRSGLGAFLKRMLVAAGLAKEPLQSARENRALDTFARHLSVYQVSKSRVIAVDFYSRDPKLASMVANRLAEAYLTWQQHEKIRRNKDASAWLTAQIDTLRKQVQEAEAKVEKFRSSAGLVAGRNNETLEAQQLSELNSQLILAKAARTETEARANLINRMLKEKGDVSAAPDVLRSGLIQRLLEQRVRVRRELAELSATLLPSHPRIKQLNSELADLGRQIRQEASKIVVGLKNETQIAGAREASLRDSLNELKQQSGQSSEDQIKLRAFEREAKANRDLLESYLARYREANARGDELSVPAHASIIMRAHVMTQPSFPKKGAMSFLVAVAVGLVSIAWVIVKELVTATHYQGGSRPVAAASGRIFSTSHKSREVTGELLHDAPGVRRGMRVKTTEDAARFIAAKYANAGPHILIVAADSHQADTAKETLATARALAAGGLSIAVVDFCARDSSIAGLIGASSIPGVAELMARTANFEDVISVDHASGVQIIPSGTLRPDSFNSADGTSWSRIQQVLGEIYDCVVLHTSLSGARRLVQSNPPHTVTVLLITRDSRNPELASQIAEHVMPGQDSPVDVILYEGAGRAQYGAAVKSALCGNALPLFKRPSF